MQEVERKSLELDKAIDELNERFEAAVREKEEMFRSLGITPEMLARFEERLSARDKKILEEMREKVDREIDAAMAASRPETIQSSFKRPKGLRV